MPTAYVHGHTPKRKTEKKAGRLFFALFFWGPWVVKLRKRQDRSGFDGVPRRYPRTLRASRSASGYDAGKI
jgi:hypothetical protein